MRVGVISRCLMAPLPKLSPPNILRAKSLSLLLGFRKASGTRSTTLFVPSNTPLKQNKKSGYF